MASLPLFSWRTERHRVKIQRCWTERVSEGSALFSSSDSAARVSLRRPRFGSAGSDGLCGSFRSLPIAALPVPSGSLGTAVLGGREGVLQRRPCRGVAYVWRQDGMPSLQHGSEQNSTVVAGCCSNVSWAHRPCSVGDNVVVQHLLVGVRVSRAVWAELSAPSL